MKGKEMLKNALPWIACLLADMLLLAGFWTWGYKTGEGKAGQGTLRESVSSRDSARTVTTEVTTRTVEARHVMPKAVEERQVGKAGWRGRRESGDSGYSRYSGYSSYSSYSSDSRDSGDSRDSDHSGYSSDSVMVPITQKVYRDSDYTAWVSGYQARLDSIKVKSKVTMVDKKETVAMVEKTVAMVKKKDKAKKGSWLNAGLTLGAGYGVLTKKPDVFVGVGVTWNIFR